MHYATLVRTLYPYYDVRSYTTSRTPNIVTPTIRNYELTCNCSAKESKELAHLILFYFGPIMEDESDLSLPEVMYLLVDSNGHDRLLQANFNETAGLTHTEILRTTCKVYGSLFLGLFVVFLFARSGFPGTYNIKNTYKELNCRVALKSYGFFSWIWHIFTVQYEDIAEQCGMDAASTIRLLEFGAKLSFVGVINSFYLLPVYKYLGTTGTYHQFMLFPVFPF